LKLTRYFGYICFTRAEKEKQLDVNSNFDEALEKAFTYQRDLQGFWLEPSLAGYPYCDFGPHLRSSIYKRPELRQCIVSDPPQ
jgi:hypothetical protein